MNITNVYLAYTKFTNVYWTNKNLHYIGLI